MRHYLGCGFVSSDKHLLKIRKNVLPPSSGIKSIASKTTVAIRLFSSNIQIFDREDENSTGLKNILAFPPYFATQNCSLLQFESKCIYITSLTKWFLLYLRWWGIIGIFSSFLVIVKHLVMKNAVFWIVMLCGSCKNWRSSETSFLTRTTRPNIPEDGIPHSHRRENLNLTKHLIVREMTVGGYHTLWVSYGCYQFYWDTRLLYVMLYAVMKHDCHNMWKYVLYLISKAKRCKHWRSNTI
jgi:hypothetical protein